MTSGATVIRVQIQFTAEELAALRAEAEQRHISVSAVVREAVDERMSRPSRLPATSLEERKARAIAACGRFHSGLRDLSIRHDEYFTDPIDE